MIFLDLDGVLVDFVGSVMRLHGRTFDRTEWPRGCWNIHDVLGIPEVCMWERIDAAGSAFWANLMPYSWAYELIALAELSGKFRICTAPSMSVHSAHGKAIWLEKHGLTAASIFCRDKHLLAAPGRTLIDDSPINCERWQAAGGTAVLFPQPWNRSELTVEEVKDFITDDNSGFVRSGY